MKDRIEATIKIVKLYYPEATEEQASRIVDMWFNHNDMINYGDMPIFNTIDEWLCDSEKNGFTLQEMLGE